MRRYALKHEAYAMKPATDASPGRARRNAELGDLDLSISGTHLIDRNPCPTSGGIVLDSVVTRPKTIAGCVSRAVTHIHHNFSIIKTISTGWWRRCACPGKSAEPRRSRT